MLPSAWEVPKAAHLDELRERLQGVPAMPSAPPHQPTHGEHPMDVGISDVCGVGAEARPTFRDGSYETRRGRHSQAGTPPSRDEIVQPRPCRPNDVETNRLCIIECSSTISHVNCQKFGQSLADALLAAPVSRRV